MVSNRIRIDPDELNFLREQHHDPDQKPGDYDDWVLDEKPCRVCGRFAEKQVLSIAGTNRSTTTTMICKKSLFCQFVYMDYYRKIEAKKKATREKNKEKKKEKKKRKLENLAKARAALAKARAAKKMKKQAYIRGPAHLIRVSK